MSEWEGVVFCTCFQDGLTREPPVPRDMLTINKFGIVTLAGSTDHAEDPDDLWCWRVGMTLNRPANEDAPQPCRHHYMKLVSEIFYWPGSRSHTVNYPEFERLVADGDFPLLNELIYRSEGDDYPSGGIWVEANEAAPILAELRRLQPLLPDDAPEGDAYFAATLESLLKASARSGNPIIVHYNGVADGAW